VDTPIYCKVHRQQPLTVENNNGRYEAEPCHLCIAVAMVKVKRRLRQNLDQVLNMSVLEKEGRDDKIPTRIQFQR